MRKKQVEVFRGKIKWIKVGVHSGRGGVPYLARTGMCCPKRVCMVFEVLSPKQGQQFHFFACGKGVSRLSGLFGKESLNRVWTTTMRFPATCVVSTIFFFLKI